MQEISFRFYGFKKTPQPQSVDKSQLNINLLTSYQLTKKLRFIKA